MSVPSEAHLTVPQGVGKPQVESDPQRGPFYLFPSLPVSWQLPPDEGPPGSLPCVFCEISSFPFFPFVLSFFSFFFLGTGERASVGCTPTLALRGPLWRGVASPPPLIPGHTPTSPAHSLHPRGLQEAPGTPHRNKGALRDMGPAPLPLFFAISLCFLSVFPSFCRLGEKAVTQPPLHSPPSSPSRALAQTSLPLSFLGF